MNYLEEYYNKYDEEGRLLSRHGQVEYLTTMRYIEECLEGTSDPSILEVGAGTGRRSVASCTATRPNLTDSVLHYHHFRGCQTYLLVLVI